MNEKLGVGIIVGLMFASSMFVYNSDKFSKVQKTVLLFFVLFPPLQWASILILLLIDYYKNSIQNVANRKVQTETTNYEDKISTLRELRNKELLTEDEYNQKADILKNSIAETELKQSDDYKKLKSLFDDNILTKEEFEQKMQILSERPPVQRPISKVQETNNSYWKIIAGIIILFVGGFLLIKMYNTRNREITYNNSDEIYMDSSAVDYKPIDTSAVDAVTVDYESEDTLEKNPKTIKLKNTLVLFDNINGIYPGQSSLNDIKSIMGEPDYIDVTKFETHSGEITGGNKLVKYVKSGIRFLFTADDMNMSVVDGILISKNFDGISNEGIYIGMKKDDCIRILNNYYFQDSEVAESMFYAEKRGAKWKLQVWFKNHKLESLEIF